MDNFRVCVVLVGGAVSVEHDAGVYYGIPFCDMCVCHVGWTKVEDSVGSLGRLEYGVFAARSSGV
jgi:hypothetical protein